MSHNLKFNGFVFSTKNASSLGLVEYGNHLSESFQQKRKFDIKFKNMIAGKNCDFMLT